MRLENKKILFFAPSFFGYEYAIKNKLEELGALVDLYDERPSSNSFIKAIIRSHKKYLRFFISQLIQRYFTFIIKENYDKNYDYIFIIKGEIFDEKIVLKLKGHYPNAKLILYLWDSITIYKSIQNSLYLFDRAFTFDSKDALQFEKLKFRPLFYIDKYSDFNIKDDLKFENDILFIGTAHSDRWVFLQKIKQQALKQGLKVDFYLYIQSPLVFLARKIFDKKQKGLSIRDVNFKSLSQDEIVKRTHTSKSVLDIQHPKQTGMTMRTIEVFGAQRKLITTNQNIDQYDFFEPNNISVIDRENPILSNDFFEVDFRKSSSLLIHKYSILGWINDIFELR